MPAHCESVGVTCLPQVPCLWVLGGPSPPPLGMLSFLPTLTPQVYCPTSKTDELSTQQVQDATFTGEYTKAQRRSGHLDTKPQSDLKCSHHPTTLPGWCVPLAGMEGGGDSSYKTQNKPRSTALLGVWRYLVRTPLTPFGGPLPRTRSR